MKLLSYRNNFNPVSVRVINKVNSHRRVFVADTAHLFMLLVECIIVICFKCKMEFLISKVIRFLSVSHPCKFQIESCSTVTEIDDFETAITGIFFADNGKTDCFLIKSNTFFKV